MNADKSKGKLGLVRDTPTIAEAKHFQGFIGVHRRSSAVSLLFIQALQ
jgi:hypothetical protein